MVSEEYFLRLTVAVSFQKKNEYFKNVSFLVLSLSLIMAWLSQNKFIFHPHF